MDTENQQPVNESFFNAAFSARVDGNKEFKPITDERAKEILDECINWHEEIYLPAERESEIKLGRKLNYGEQMILCLNLKFGDTE